MPVVAARGRVRRDALERRDHHRRAEREEGREALEGRRGGVGGERPRVRRAEHVGLALEPSREPSEHHEPEEGQGEQREQEVGALGQQRERQLLRRTQEQHQGEGQREVGGEVSQLRVAGLVRHDGQGLGARQGGEQRVRDEHVAGASRQAHDHRVQHAALGVPEEDVLAAHADRGAQELHLAPRLAVLERLRAQDAADDLGTEPRQDDEEAQDDDGLGVGEGLVPEEDRPEARHLPGVEDEERLLERQEDQHRHEHDRVATQAPLHRAPRRRRVERVEPRLDPAGGDPGARDHEREGREEEQDREQEPGAGHQSATREPQSKTKITRPHPTNGMMPVERPALSSARPSWSSTARIARSAAMRQRVATTRTAAAVPAIAFQGSIVGVARRPVGREPEHQGDEEGQVREHGGADCTG